MFWLGHLILLKKGPAWVVMEVVSSLMLLWVLILFAYFPREWWRESNIEFYVLSSGLEECKIHLDKGKSSSRSSWSASNLHARFFFFSFFGELLLFLVIGASESENRRIFELALMLKSINLDHCCLKSLFQEMSFLVPWNCYLTIYHVFFCCLICFAFHTFHVNGNFSYLALWQNVMIIFVCFNRSSIVGWCSKGQEHNW